MGLNWFWREIGKGQLRGERSVHVTTVVIIS